MNKKVVILSGVIAAVLVALVVAIIALTGSVKDDSKDKGETNEKEKTTNKTTEAWDKNIQTELNKIIEDELYVLNGKKSLKDLTNQDLLLFVYNKGIYKDDIPVEFTGSEVLEFFKGTSLSKLGITNEDISDGYKYNASTDKYALADGIWGGDLINPVYSSISDYKVEDNKYTVSVKYLWAYCYDDTTVYEVYGSYELVDGAREFDYTDEGRKAADEYVRNNAVSGKEMDTYTTSDEQYEEYIREYSKETYNYVFEKVDGRFYIVDFYRS